MKKDIILAGVGGQGILSIATVIAEAATRAGIYLKQAEVHGMSQRGGDVQSHLRLSTEPIHSDLIPHGEADLIIAMEPMEALRYVPWLTPDGWVITSSEPFINIPNYPDTDTLLQALQALPRLRMQPIEAQARQLGAPKSANMILLGMAAPYLDLLTPDQLKEAIATVFARKGETIVGKNQEAYYLGIQSHEAIQ